MTTQEFEKVIIKALYANQSICSKVLPELTDKWFSEYDTKQIVNKIIEFNTKYSNLPNAIELKRMITDEKTLKVFDDVLAIDDNQVNTPYLMGEIEEFVRKKLLLNQATKIQQYANGGVQKESFTDNIADAEAFTFDDNIGFDFFTEAQRLYEDANTKEVIFKSGLKTLDDLIGGGFHEKSLSLIMSSTNVGKTLIMCALTTNFVLHGYRVLYVTFEDSENKIATRIAQNMFDITQSQYKVMSRDDFAKAFTKAKSIAGGDKLIIKEYPEGTVNALQIEALIKDLKDKKKFVPDVLVVDYIGCMIPNGKPNANLNTNTTLQLVAAQTRALAQVHGFPIISGLQANSGGNGIAELSLSDVADSFASTMKADAIFGVTQPDEFQQQNVYCMKLLKTRYGGKNRGATFLVGVDTEKQRIYDVAQDKVANDTVNIFDSQPISKNDGSVELDEIDYL
jgi:replicative DNA helicase